MVMNKKLTWPQYAMSLAVKAAEGRCEDPYLQVGACCLRHDNSVASIGYNGAPPGIEIDWSSREQRRKRVLHAEQNALKYVRPGEVKLIAVTTIPCLSCLALIAAQGIKEVVYMEEWENGDPEVYQIASEFNINLHKLEL